MARPCAVLALLSLSAGVTAVSLRDDNNVTLYLLPPDIVSSFGAACLDGSPPALYVRYTEGNRKWKVHLHGGGWCTSAVDCYYRAIDNYDNMGSSRDLPAAINTTDNAIFGVMNGDDSNPVGGYNLALVMYCDGSSWSSDRIAPVVYNGTALWMRGRRNLDATLYFLETLGGFLSASTDVILTGTSAGGMATYMHAEYVRTRLPASASLVGLPDAGFFLDAPNLAGEYVFSAGFQAAVGPALWNATYLGSNAACLGDRSPDTAWQCWFPQYLYPYLTTVPFYIMNSMFDTAQLGSILQLGCTPPLGDCNATQLAAMYAYADTLKANVTAAVALHGGRDGYFLHGCVQHESSCRDPDFMGITAPNGLTPNASFTAWWSSSPPPPVATSRVVDAAWPGDASCQPYGFRHGGC